MVEFVENDRVRKKKSWKWLLLLVAVLLSPLSCCGATYVLDILPATLVPSFLDLTINLFEEEIRIENRTGETVYLTPITTTTGKPVVISQLAILRYRDIPLKPGDSVLLTFDMADMPLSGIAVCREKDDCRKLGKDQMGTISGEYTLQSVESLPVLDEEWHLALRSSPKYNFQIFLYPVCGIIPVTLFGIWLYLAIREKRRNRGEPDPGSE